MKEFAYISPIVNKMTPVSCYSEHRITCNKGTSSIGSSAPRSPRATMACKINRTLKMKLDANVDKDLDLIYDIE